MDLLRLVLNRGTRAKLSGDTRRAIHARLLAEADKVLAEPVGAEQPEAWFEEYWRDLERILGRDPDDFLRDFKR